MKLFDVHTNRSPIDGVVMMSKHNPGKFISMTKEKFEIMNESQTTILKHNDGYFIGIIQIATFFVRGIESYLNEGDSIKQGERIGRIKLGSQVDVVIPFTEIKLKIKLGERVYAGETVLAEITRANKVVLQDLATQDVRMDEPWTFAGKKRCPEKNEF